jgi:uncharacterized membrane protein
MIKKLNTFVATIASILTLLALDFAYLGVMTLFYKKSIKTIQGGEDMKITIIPAVMCYIIMVIGLVFIVITQLSRYGNVRGLSLTNKMKYALRFGGVLGFVIYGVFNTTNLAVFRRYSVPLSIIDILWGTILYTVATLVYLVLS